MNALPPNATLIIIDVQQGFDEPIWGQRNNPQAEENIALLLTAWRSSKRPIIHIQHLSRQPDSTLHPDHPGSAIKPIVQPLPDEPIIQKNVNSAFIGTDLEVRLRQNNLSTLVIVGLTTDHCVSTTTRMAGNLGFDTYIVSDATATFERDGYDGRHYSADEIHAISLVSLNGEFATVVATDRLLQYI
jgi:nicotinamidase-related amidase